MAASPRCLCLILTLWATVSRPSAPGQASSPDSGWWGAKESVRLRHSAGQRVAAGEFSAAADLYAKAARLAIAHGDRIAAARYLTGVAGARMARYEYRAALGTYLEARTLARATHDRQDLGAIAFNLSTLYQQVWDFDSAQRALDESLAALQEIPNAYYKPQLLLQSGRLRDNLGEDGWEPLLEEGIEAARASRDPNMVAVEAQGWDLLGEGRLAHGDLKGAEQAHLQAFLLRRLFVPRDLGFSYWRLGALRLAQAGATQDRSRRAQLLDQAAHLIDKAIAEATAGEGSTPAYQLRHLRGRIRLAQGNILGALDDLQASVEMAESWRLGIPTAFSSLDGTSAGLEQRIFDTFVEAAGDYGIRTGDRRWIEESFQVAKMNPASGLEDSEALAEVWRRKLPTEFWEDLGRLRAVDANLLRGSARKNPEAERLRLKLTEMEAAAGLGFPLNRAENFRSHYSLIHFQHGLGDSTAFLSFHLGGRESFLWVATRNSLHLYRLAPRDQVRKAVRKFRKAVEEGSPQTEVLGEQLYRMLFGGLRAEERGKPRWLLSLDGVLFDLPIAALVPERSGPKVRVTERARPEGLASNRRSGKIVYLVEGHSLEIVPGALLSGAKLSGEKLSKEKPSGEKPSGGSPGEQARTGGRFLAVGDPIYNVADPRWQGTHATQRGFLAPLLSAAAQPKALLAPRFTSVFASGPEEQFNRLPGSGREVKVSAAAWAAGRPAGGITLLTGASASLARFRAELSPAPAVIHLATHVLTPAAQPDQAFLAFGLDAGARAELLATSDVAMLHAPGSLVVMTGCATGAGNPRAGVGLEGLTRAWTIAGASAVVATEWPVQDSSGELLAGFYRYLHEFPPAEALRRSQVEMIHSGTAFAAPAQWASYEVFGAHSAGSAR
jgi:CHAT domain